jgi:Trypsin
VHPKYNSKTRVYDVALVRLSREINITTHVRPICLWDDDYSMDKIRGKEGIVSETKNVSKIFADRISLCNLRSSAGAIWEKRDCRLKSCSLEK